jgi:hypothetical protein
MAFDVLITDEAFADLDSITDFIKGSSSLETARKWFAGSTPPSRKTTPPIQNILRHSRGHKDGRVFHVRHWARKHINADELQELMDDAADWEE